MKSNYDVVQAFYKKQSAKNASMSTNGLKLYSYNTCIAEHIDGKIVVNKSKYSNTTSKQQNLLTKYDTILTNLDRNIVSLKPYLK